MSNPFPKSERLCAKKDIDALFAQGRNVRQGKLLIKYTLHDRIEPNELVKVLIVVPKRNARRAVRRNRIKRLAREAYRLNKDILAEFLLKSNKTIHFAVIWSDGEDLTYDEFEVVYKMALSKFATLLKS
jgi:ribonuclease P protein component